MTGELPDTLRAAADRFDQTARECRDAAAAALDTARRARYAAQDPPAALQRQVDDYFRAGSAGAEVRTLQLAVDSGAVTWQGLGAGQGDAAMVALFRAHHLTIFAACRQLADAYRAGGDPGTDAVLRDG